MRFSKCLCHFSFVCKFISPFIMIKCLKSNNSLGFFFEDVLKTSLSLIGCLKGLKSIRLLSTLVSELDFIFSSFLIHIEPLLRFQIYPASLLFVTPIYTFLFLYLYLYQKNVKTQRTSLSRGQQRHFLFPRLLLS